MVLHKKCRALWGSARGIPRLWLPRLRDGRMPALERGWHVCRFRGSDSQGVSSTLPGDGRHDSLLRNPAVSESERPGRTACCSLVSVHQIRSHGCGHGQRPSPSVMARRWGAETGQMSRSQVGRVLQRADEGGSGARSPFARRTSVRRMLSVIQSLRRASPRSVGFFLSKAEVSV